MASIVESNKGKLLGGTSGKGFKPGQSGNPGGRKKVPEDVKKLLEAAAPGAIKYMIETLQDEEVNKSVRLECAKTLLDRAYGKAQQAVDLDSNSIIEIKLSNELTTYGS